MTWDEIFTNKIFITDLNENQTVSEGSNEISIGRYAVWSPLKNSKGHQIVEVGDNLEFLQSKYNISEDRICILAK